MSTNPLTPTFASQTPIPDSRATQAGPFFEVLAHMAGSLSTIAQAAPKVAEAAAAIAEALQPIPTRLVTTEYVAQKMGVTKIYAAQLAREGKIPQACIATGGGGNAWKFHRDKIDEWLDMKGRTCLLEKTYVTQT